MNLSKSVFEKFVYAEAYHLAIKLHREGFRIDDLITKSDQASIALDHYHTVFQKYDQIHQYCILIEHHNLPATIRYFHYNVHTICGEDVKDIGTVYDRHAVIKLLKEQYLL